MRKVIFYLIVGVISFGMISCGGETKKAETIDELINKYDGKVFETCDEMIEFGYEYIDVMIATIDRAADGDEEAIEDFDKMDDFFRQFESQQIQLEQECPEKFQEFGVNAEELMAESMEKLMNILFGDMDMDWEDEWDDEWDEDWDEEWEEYEEDYM